MPLLSKKLSKPLRFAAIMLFSLPVIAEDIPTSDLESSLSAAELAYEPTIAEQLKLNTLDNGYLDLTWEALVPVDWIEPEPEPIDWSISDEALLEQAMMPSQIKGPTVAGLAKQKIRLPGFIVPLDFTLGSFKEFLFVPYVGACVHVPPPPTNQLLLVRSTTNIEQVDMWQPVFVFGTLSIDEQENEIGNSSYSLQLDSIAPYDEF